MMLCPRILGAALALILGATLLPRNARADAGATSSAAAEALFEDAVKLMESKDFAAACEKFRASQDLDPALGTLLRLADCYDREGKTASAWATFKEVASVAAQRGQSERQHTAEERVTDLETRLSRLEIVVAAGNRPSGLEVKLNGVNVPAASWNSALPVDPGAQKLSASAPGRKAWSGSIDVPEGPAQVKLEVPALKSAPKPPADETQGSNSANTGSTQRTIGYIMGGVGIASLAASGVLAYRAHSLREQSLDQCSATDANSCTAEGVELREDSMKYAQAANYPFFAGAALLAGGIAVVLTAPSGETQRAAAPRFTASVNPVTGRIGMGVTAKW